MALAYVPLIIDQGEDWTAQVIITDQNGNNLDLARPMQMDMKNQVGLLVLSLHSISVEDEQTTLDIPEISFSSDIGMIQIHINKDVTSAMDPGTYSYDLFASVDDGNVYAGSQRIRVIAGNATINKKVTEF